MKIFYNNPAKEGEPESSVMEMDGRSKNCVVRQESPVIRKDRGSESEWVYLNDYFNDYLSRPFHNRNYFVSIGGRHSLLF